MAPDNRKRAAAGQASGAAKKGPSVQEVLRTNDLVRLSFAEALLRDAGLTPIVLDTHASVMDGSIVAVRRRLMVADDEAEQARAILKDGLPG